MAGDAFQAGPEGDLESGVGGQRTLREAMAIKRERLRVKRAVKERRTAGHATTVQDERT